MEINFDVGIAVIMIGFGIFIAAIGISTIFEAPQSETSQVIDSCRTSCVSAFNDESEKKCFLECINLIGLNYSKKKGD